MIYLLYKVSNTTHNKEVLHMNTSANYETVVDYINEYNLTGEQVLDLLTNYHGLQIMTNDFVEYTKDELGINE